MKRRRTNCIVSCSPRYGIEAIDARMLEEMVNETETTGDVRHQWHRQMELGRLAERASHYYKALTCYEKACAFCLCADYERLTRRYAYAAQDAAMALDRIWRQMGVKNAGYYRKVLEVYEDIWWMAHGE